jgi:predicted DNA-binding protein
MPRGSKVASKRKQTVESVHDRDRIIVRLPDGMRDRLAAIAEANGRSMTAEVVAAIEQHLQGTDRITQLWEFFGKHSENIEAIPQILAAVEQIEIYLSHQSAEGDTPAVLRNWGRQKQRDAREAALPLVTADQVQTIKALLNETGVDEARFLALMRKPRIEEIRDFEWAIGLLKAKKRHERSE